MADAARRHMPPVLKYTPVFLAIHRRGRWVRGHHVSVGWLAREAGAGRVGIRTRRGLKGAVIRNRLKRQVRAQLRTRALSVRAGVDVLIVIHPKHLPIAADMLGAELVKAWSRGHLHC